jgi:hypothetical protein
VFYVHYNHILIWINQEWSSTVSKTDSAFLNPANSCLVETGSSPLAALALSHIFCRCYSLVLNVEKHVIAVIVGVIAVIVAVIAVIVGVIAVIVGVIAVIVAVIVAVIAVIVAVIAVIVGVIAVIVGVIVLVFLLVVRTDSWCCMFLLAAFSNCPKGMTDATHVATHSFQICDAIYITSHKYV